MEALVRRATILISVSALIFGGGLFGWSTHRAGQIQETTTTTYRSLNRALAECESDPSRCDGVEVLRRDFDDLVAYRDMTAERAEFGAIIAVAVPLLCLWLFFAYQWIARGVPPWALTSPVLQERGRAISTGSMIMLLAALAATAAGIYVLGTQAVGVLISTIVQVAGTGLVAWVALRARRGPQR